MRPIFAKQIWETPFNQPSSAPSAPSAASGVCQFLADLFVRTPAFGVPVAPLGRNRSFQALLEAIDLPAGVTLTVIDHKQVLQVSSQQEIPLTQIFYQAKQIVDHKGGDRTATSYLQAEKIADTLAFTGYKPVVLRVTFGGSASRGANLQGEYAVASTIDSDGAHWVLDPLGFGEPVLIAEWFAASVRVAGKRPDLKLKIEGANFPSGLAEKVLTPTAATPTKPSSSPVLAPPSKASPSRPIPRKSPKPRSFGSPSPLSQQPSQQSGDSKVPSKSHIIRDRRLSKSCELQPHVQEEPKY
jgi:hypothetical protein